MIKLNEKEKKFKNHTELKFDVDLQFRRLRRNWVLIWLQFALRLHIFMNI